MYKLSCEILGVTNTMKNCDVWLIVLTMIKKQYLVDLNINAGYPLPGGAGVGCLQNCFTRRMKFAPG